MPHTARPTREFRVVNGIRETTPTSFAGKADRASFSAVMEDGVWAVSINGGHVGDAPTRGQAMALVVKHLPRTTGRG